MAHIRDDLSNGKRTYVQTTYGEAITARLKELGVHYDRERHEQGERGLWWIGSAKRKQVEELLVGADKIEDLAREKGEPTPPPAKEDLDKCRVYAQVEYKGRKYYVVAEQKRTDGQPVRCRLTTLDGLPSGPFWADCQACSLVRTYEGREKWDGRHYSGRTVTVYSTIGSLREFRDRQKDPATRRGECTECGHYGPSGTTCTECHEGTHV